MKHIKKLGSVVVIFLTLDILVLLGFAWLGYHSTKEPEVVKVETGKLPENCWTGGENRPMPNAVIYDDKIYGEKMVGKALDTLFAKGPLDPKKIGGFCLIP